MITDQDIQLLDEYLDAGFKAKHTDQGSEEWGKLRIGRFTSSQIYRIMECGKRPMTPVELAARPKKGKGSATTQVPDPKQMSKGGMTYIRQKVWEILTGKSQTTPYAYAIAYGKEMEPEAVKYFEEKTGLETYAVGFQVYTDYSGGSPDRLIGEDEGLEVKCPSSDEQIDYLMLTDHWDLKRDYAQIYWQCVSLLLFTGRKRWHLATFDPRMKEEKHKMTHIIIEAEKVFEDMELIPIAIAGAVEQLLKDLKTLS